MPRLNHFGTPSWFVKRFDKGAVLPESRRLGAMELLVAGVGTCTLSNGYLDP